MRQPIELSCLYSRGTDQPSAWPTVPVTDDDFTGPCGAVEVLRHPRVRGPAAARNTGLAAVRTDFVAFLDSDVVPRPCWLEALLGHFCDPTVALAAPRIVSLNDPAGAVARYEAVHSSLDLGHREAPVVPYGTVSYVPSAALICRTAALREIGGFDESLHSGEDVDLCWRLVETGARLRYEPVALVAHDHRTELRDWFGRKAFYGSSAAPLSVRHPDKIAPMVISGWTLLPWLLIAVGSFPGYLVSAVMAAIAGNRIFRVLRGPETKVRDVAEVTARGLGIAALQLSSAACRHYWPLALFAALASRRCRRAVLGAAVLDGAADWVRHTRTAADDGKPLGLVSYLALKRLDDLAYGLGLWFGAARERTVAPLKPQVRA